MGKEIPDRNMNPDRDNRRQRLLELFCVCVVKYTDSIQYVKSEKNKLKRALYGFNTFGFSYILYNLARFRVPGLFGHISCKLFFGRKMVLPISDIGANVFSMYGILPHKSERKLALWIMKNLEDSEIFYDVGAHLGYYTALSEKLLTKGEVHAFEANDKLCRYLDRNFSTSKGVYISCTAIADSVGEVDFYDATKTEDSSVSSRFNLSGLHVIPSRIAATTLDEYVKVGNKLPTVIKFDIEGGEYDAILGAIGLIKEHKPRIIMEVWSGEIGRKYSDKAIKKLQEFGYKAFPLKSDGSVSEESTDDPVGSISDSSKGARDNFLFIAE